jgi:hypothetical protein
MSITLHVDLCVFHVVGSGVCQWRNEGGGLGVQTPPPPKFWSFDKAEPNSQLRGKYIRNCLVLLFIILISLKIAEFRTPTPQGVRKKAVKF